MMQPGKKIREYLLERKLGAGGMGEVWQAHHCLLDRDFAVKALCEQLVKDRSMEARFVQEAKAQARLHHPRIISVCQFFVEGDNYYLIMPLVRGESLQQRLAHSGGRLPLAEAVAISHDVLAALAYAHQQGVVHRDIKPSNILLNEQHRAHLVDFGLALICGQPRTTAVGLSVGTPCYMSPEQIDRDRSIDHRSDIYNFGCVLYQMLTGRTPFEDSAKEGMTAVMMAHLNRPPIPLRQFNPEVPIAVERIVMKALAKDAGDRFARCEDFATALTLAVNAQPLRTAVSVPLAQTDNTPPRQTDRSIDSSKRTNDGINQPKITGQFVERRRTARPVPFERRINWQQPVSPQRFQPEIITQSATDQEIAARRSERRKISLLVGSCLTALAAFWLVILLIAPSFIDKHRLASGTTAEDQTYLDAGNDYYQKGDYDDAIDSYSHAIVIKPNNGEAYNARGIAYAALKKHAQAIADYNQAINYQRGSYRPYYNRALSYAAQNRLDQAINDFSAAIKLQPDFPYAYYGRGLANKLKGNNDQALVDYTEAIKLKADYMQAYYDRGVAHYAKGMLPAALSDFDHAISLNSSEPYSYYGRGVVYAAQGSYASAIGDYSQAIIIKPDYAEAYYGRGLAYKALGQRAEALADFRAVFRLNQSEDASAQIKELSEPVYSTE